MRDASRGRQKVVPTIASLRLCRLDGETFDQIARRFRLDRADVEDLLASADLWRTKPRASDLERRVFVYHRRGYSFGLALASARADMRKASGVAAPDAVGSAIPSRILDPSRLRGDRSGDGDFHAHKHGDRAP